MHTFFRFETDSVTESKYVLYLRQIWGTLLEYYHYMLLYTYITTYQKGILYFLLTKWITLVKDAILLQSWCFNLIVWRFSLIVESHSQDSSILLDLWVHFTEATPVMSHIWRLLNAGHSLVLDNFHTVQWHMHSSNWSEPFFGLCPSLRPPSVCNLPMNLPALPDLRYPQASPRHWPSTEAA